MKRHVRYVCAVQGHDRWGLDGTTLSSAGRRREGRAQDEAPGVIAATRLETEEFIRLLSFARPSCGVKARVQLVVKRGIPHVVTPRQHDVCSRNTGPG